MNAEGPKPSRPTMWCKTCGYALDGLGEERCPECGRAFDPDNKRSYLSRPYRVGRAFTLVALISLIVAVLGAGLWIRSYRIQDIIYRGVYELSGVPREPFDQCVWLKTMPGTCVLSLERGAPPTVPGVRVVYRGDLKYEATPLQDHPMMDLYEMFPELVQPKLRLSLTGAEVPFRVLIPCAFAVPVIWLLRWRWARRMRQG
jgi:hypothetical protein